jgi:hypothetical protein
MMKVNFTPNFPQFSTAFHSHLVYTADVTETAEKSEFCTMLYAAERSGLGLKTWYEGGAGTSSVPRIRFGRSIRLLRNDVENFIAERIKEAKDTTDKSTKP